MSYLWGFNAEMLRKSKTLFGYSFFVDLARQYADAGCELEEAIRRAVEDCIGKGILADFLRDRSSEVINMLTAEFKLEDALQVWKEEGIEEGIEKMAKNLFSKGISLDVIAQSAGLPLEKIQTFVN
jgi:predicted transposase/invertase (TIGR01784 family)